MADYSIEVSIPNAGPVGPQGPPGEFGELEAPEDGIIYGRKDGEWVDMTAPANLQVRRGTAAEVAAITPLEGEPVWATDTKILVVGDGSSAGGVQVGNFPIVGTRPTAATLPGQGKLSLADSMNQVGGTAVLGGTRGAGSLDLQSRRTASTQIASGLTSVVLGGLNNTASGNTSIVLGGSTNTASGLRASVINGLNCSSGGTYALVHGENAVASANYSAALGYFPTADRQNMVAVGANLITNFAGRGQAVTWVLRARTSNNTPASMLLANDVLPTIPSGVALFATIQICAIEETSATESAHYVRKFAIQNLGGTTSLIGSVTTVGTDHESDSAYDVALTADNANSALSVAVTGDTSKTLRWMAVVTGAEMAIAP
jgi:hypothetical protein